MPTQPLMQDPLLNWMPFMAIFMPLAGFVVLSLFGDAIKREGESAGAAVVACLTVLTSLGLLSRPPCACTACCRGGRFAAQLPRHRVDRRGGLPRLAEPLVDRFRRS